MKKSLAALSLAALMFLGVNTTTEAFFWNKNKESEEFVLRVAYGLQEDQESKVEASTQFLKDLKAAVGIEVEWFEPSSTVALTQSLMARENETHLAYTGAMDYYLISERADISPVASFAKDGDKENWGKRSVYVSRPGLGIDDFSVESLINEDNPYTLAFSKMSSTSTFLWPVNDMINANIIEGQDDFFKKFKALESGGTSQSIAAMLDGDADIALMSTNSYERNKDILTEENHVLFHKSSPIPDNLWLMNNKVPEEVQAKIREFILNYNDPTFMHDFYGKKDEQHISISHSDFEIIGSIMTNLGLKEF